jgi:hypothetical protein
MLNLKLSRAKNTDHRRSPAAKFYRFLSSEVPTGQTHIQESKCECPTRQTNSWAGKNELPTTQTNIQESKYEFPTGQTNIQGSKCECPTRQTTNCGRNSFSSSSAKCCNAKASLSISSVIFVLSLNNNDDSIPSHHHVLQFFFPDFFNFQRRLLAGFFYKFTFQKHINSTYCGN